MNHTKILGDFVSLYYNMPSVAVSCPQDGTSISLLVKNIAVSGCKTSSN